MKKFHINPNWNIEEFYDLEYVIKPFHNDYQINEYIAAGHKREHLDIHKYLEPNPMPSFVYDYIYPFFSHLNDVVSAVNLFKPATYLPYHSDSYFAYKKLFNITTETIERTVVMLEDWVPGQIILIEDQSFSGWKSGDCFSWQNDTKHSFYNMSLVNRYALQITGHTDIIEAN
jgi:hypothetical protein